MKERKSIMKSKGFYNCCYTCAGLRTYNCHASCQLYLMAKAKAKAYKKKHPDYNAYQSERGWSYIRKKDQQQI